ncbi:MAG: hypothetical protein EXX96DRAFT_248595 [Benjaminiella poitrasii]|nr:MAG: hypothetical protein EXX96DRAFT_248595 [Benjaminiella poitrasii]
MSSYTFKLEPLLTMNNLKAHQELEAIEGLLRLQGKQRDTSTFLFNPPERSLPSPPSPSLPSPILLPPIREDCFISSRHRRGRPRTNQMIAKNDGLKILNLTASEYASHTTTTTAKRNETKKVGKRPGREGLLTSNKPRWQNHERQGLLEAIVREKCLDDMTTIPWDAISKSVGRAKKACKDQWRRELLPYLIDGLFATNQHTRQAAHNEFRLSKYNSTTSRKRRNNDV